MISSLTIKNVASYENANPVVITDLKKVNFFFGFNGSGKSTIAKYLRNLGLDISQQNSTFTHCSNVGYNISLHQVLTFNEDFIEENFKRSSDFKGVFSLNQTNTVIDQQISAEESNIQSFEVQKSKYQSKIESIEGDKRLKTEELLNYCWHQRMTFSTFTKISLFYSGSRQNHFQEVKRVLQNPIGPGQSIQDLNEQYQTFYEKGIKNVNESIDTKSYLEIRRLERRLAILLNEVIIGNEDVDIAGLIQELNSRSWVEQGLNYLKLDDDTCPFCQKETIDFDLREQFEKYFDKTYKNKISEISGLIDAYRQKTNRFIQNINAVQNVFNPNNIVSNLLLSLNSLFDDNFNSLDYKISHSNERKSITFLSTEKSTLSEVIKQIKINNEHYNDLAANRQNLINNIWRYIAEQCKQEIRDFDNRVRKYSNISALAASLKNMYDGKIISATQNIETLRSQTVNTRDAIDNINTILKNSCFEGFEIDEKDKINNISRYYLKRLNTTNTNPVFESLSEGEKNFIAFLYFIQLCIGTDDLQSNGSKKKIIIIDDPVSSLDSQALFIVSTLIHLLIQRKADDNRPNRMLFKNANIAQVFILTHNIYFYKEVSFEKRFICTDYWHYKISKLNNQTSITGNYNRAVFDDYSLMWATIKDIKANLPNNSSLNIMISNSMRRIIESYVNFLGYGIDSWAALINENQNHPSYYIKCAFISTINDESHKISALDSVYYQKIINEQPQTLFNVFAATFKAIGKEHYEMMMDETL